jgi:hypothetical protein
MSAKQISIGELLEYWKYAETLKPGDIIERYIEPHRMPPWNEICSGLNWQLHTVDGGYFGSKEFGYTGVYRLFGLAAENDATKPATINRVIGQDGTGTLYIGESGWLNQRLNQLRRSLNHSEDTHGAIRMWRKTPILSARFPSRKLGVGVLFTSVNMHGWVEQDLIRAYMNSFGDSPPLNCSF